MVRGFGVAAANMFKGYFDVVDLHTYTADGVQNFYNRTDIHRKTWIKIR